MTNYPGPIIVHKSTKMGKLWSKGTDCQFVCSVSVWLTNRKWTNNESIFSKQQLANKNKTTTCQQKSPQGGYFHIGAI